MVAGVVTLGLIMAVLDTTIVNVGLETLSRDLGVGLGTIQWVSTNYLLPLAAVIPLSGWVTERFRIQAGLDRINRTLRSRIGAVCARHNGRGADRLPGAAGGRGRHAAANRLYADRSERGAGERADVRSPLSECRSCFRPCSGRSLAA